MSSARNSFSGFVTIVAMMGTVFAVEPPRATTSYDEALKLCGGHPPRSRSVQYDPVKKVYFRSYYFCWCNRLQVGFRFGGAETECPSAVLKSKKPASTRVDCVECKGDPSSAQSDEKRLTVEVGEILSRTPIAENAEPAFQSPEVKVPPAEKTHAVPTQKLARAPIDPPFQNKKTLLAKTPSTAKTGGKASKKTLPRSNRKYVADSELELLFRQVLRTQDGKIEPARVVVVLDTSGSMTGKPTELAQAIGEQARLVAEQLAGQGIEYQVIEGLVAHGRFDTPRDGDEYVEEFKRAQAWLKQAAPNEKTVVIFVGDGISGFRDLGNPATSTMRWSGRAVNGSPSTVWKDLGKTGIADRARQAILSKPSNDELIQWTHQQVLKDFAQFESAWNGLVQEGDQVFYFSPPNNGGSRRLIKSWSEYSREIPRMAELGVTGRENWASANTLVDVVSVAIDKGRSKRVTRIEMDLSSAQKQGTDAYARDLLKKSLKQTLGK